MRAGGEGEGNDVWGWGVRDVEGEDVLRKAKDGDEGLGGELCGKGGGRGWGGGE